MMTISQSILDFLNSYNPTGTALTPDQLTSFTTDLKAQISQLSAAVPGAQQRKVPESISFQ